MCDDNALPLSIRDVAPAPEATRLTGTTGNGLPSGFHTGGAWLWKNEVWKPLDGRPYANCSYHYPTLEDKVLEAMAGEPLFPMNWRVEERNGRRFVVRKKAWLIPEDKPYRHLTKDELALVEQGVRNLNSRGWEIGDFISLAVDPDTYELFIYDLSTAHEMRGKPPFAADEEHRILAFFELCGADALANFRRNAWHVLSEQGTEAVLRDGIRRRHVYASFYRPFSLLWASLPGDPLLVQQKRDDSKGIPHTWILTQEPLPEDRLKSYELQWGWSPIEYVFDQ